MPDLRPRPFRRASTGDPMLDQLLDDMSRQHLQLVEHVTVLVCTQENVAHGLGVRPRGATLIRHDGTDGFRMYADCADADRELCPARFTESGVTAWIAFMA